MAAKVTFVSACPRELRADATLPVLLERMLGQWDFPGRFAGKKVAIKMHLGGGVGYSTIHPVFVRKVVQAVKAAGGAPFITDIARGVEHATDRGYTQEVLGAPIIAVAGPAEDYVRSVRTDFRTLDTVELAGNVLDADAMIVLSHGKGHGNSGFGGAIKNIAMGCVDGNTRGKLHRLVSAAFDIDHDKCKACLLCRDNCPTNTITFDEGKINIWDHGCRYCMHCQSACPNGAITIDQGGYRYFQHGMALTVRETFNAMGSQNIFYITALLHITPFCDCWGFTTPAIVPDIGIVAGDQIVAVEAASIDMIKADNFIQGSLPAPLARTGDGHLFQQIHGKDPYLQVEECEAIGLGDRKYELVEVQ